MIGDMDEIMMISYVRGEQRWLFIYRDNEADKQQILKLLSEYAADPDAPFTWHDASIVAKRVRGRSVSPEELSP